MSGVSLVVFVIAEWGLRQFLSVILIFPINYIAWTVTDIQNWFDWPLKFLCFELLSLQNSIICRELAIQTDSSVRSGSMIIMHAANALLFLGFFFFFSLESRWYMKVKT